jgi:hypothetical protein
MACPQAPSPKSWGGSSSMSFHLAALANAGLVAQRRQSRLVIYSANYPAMNGLMAYLTENCCAGLACTGGGLPPAPVSDADTQGMWHERRHHHLP